MAAQFDAVGIVVRDIDTALDFYRLLGLDLPANSGGEDHVEATLPNGMRVMFDSEKLMRDIDENWIEPVGQRVALAFRCESPADVDAVCQSIISAGYRCEREPHDAFWGQRYARVIDPDNNTVDLYCDL